MVKKKSKKPKPKRRGQTSNQEVVHQQRNSDSAGSSDSAGGSNSVGGSDSGNVSDSGNSGDTPVLIHHTAGEFPLKGTQEGLRQSLQTDGATNPFCIRFNSVDFPINQFASDTNSTLHSYPFEKSMLDYLTQRDEGVKKEAEEITRIPPVKEMFSDTDFSKVLPRDWARDLARAVIDAFIELGTEPHLGLNMIDNYVVIFPPKHPHRNPVLARNRDYDERLKVRIIHKCVNATSPTRSVKGRNNGVMQIIFREIFQKINLGPDWDDFRTALLNGRLYYCQHHPVLKPWEERLLSYVKLTSLISNRTLEHRKLAYESISECTMEDLYTKTWDGDELKKVPPLQKVRDFHSIRAEEIAERVSPHVYVSPNQIAPSTSRSSGEARNKWMEAGLLIKFIGNSYKHLTEGSWISSRPEREYKIKIDPASKNERSYRQPRFLDHLVSHFVYPKLTVALYRKLHEYGYDF